MIADIIAQDAEGRDVLLVEVRGRILEVDIIPEYRAYLESASLGIPFHMLVDLESIYIFRRDFDDPDGVACKLSTADVLTHYDPEFDSKRIFAGYLGTLVEAWLHDLAFHWKSAVPPGSEALASIGLLDRLKRGTTRSEVPLGEDSLR